MCAGINDLFSVCSELVGVAHKWKKVGLALRLDPDLLDRIEAKKNDVEDNLSDTLKEWLKKSYDTESFGDPSWKLLVDAVAHPVGGKDRALAMEIAAKYNGRFNWSYTLSLVLFSQVQITRGMQRIFGELGSEQFSISRVFLCVFRIT